MTHIEQLAQLAANAAKIQRENRAACASIDAEQVKRGCNGSGKDRADKLTGAQLAARDAKTFFERMQDKPHLQEIYKRDGILAALIAMS